MPLKKLAGQLMICTLLFAACKKNDNGNTPDPVAGNQRDSIFFIFKDIYLWTDAIPDSATFKPNSFSSTSAMFDALISIKKNAKGEPLDRYSFIDDGSTSGALQGGQAGDLGFQPIYRTSTDLRVAYVYPGSPAARQGVSRGWQLTAINGNTGLAYNDATFRLLNESLSANSASFTFKLPDGSSRNITINKASYKIDPFLHVEQYRFNGRTPVGYFVFNSFIHPDLVKTKLDSIVNAFVTAGVKDLIVDLRYNGGGIVSTAEMLANKIAPQNVGTGRNTLMYSQVFNNNVRNNRYSRYFIGRKAAPYYPDVLWTDIFNSEATTYSKAYFDKKDGFAALNSVTFLVSYNTVSASELLYNVLDPHMNAYLVGDTTYGKPVGFIDIPFKEKDMFAICFQTKNSLGQGDYFDGLKPDVQEWEDAAIGWGKKDEYLLRAAFIRLGIPESELGRKTATEFYHGRTGATKSLLGERFRGMVDIRRPR